MWIMWPRVAALQAAEGNRTLEGARSVQRCARLSSAASASTGRVAPAARARSRKASVDENSRGCNLCRNQTRVRLDAMAIEWIPHSC
jgi:hypothetical protein